MIGQIKIQNKLLKSNIEFLPKALIFEGEYGCGKHLLLNKMSQNYAIEVEDISLNISNDLLMELYLTTQNKFYLIDIDKAANNKKILLLQNTLLKFIEEPPQCAYIIIFCKAKNQLLPTIQNRCQIISFEKYTVEQLKDFCNINNIEDFPETLYEVYNTPGKLLHIKDNKNEVEELNALIINIITNMHKANIANALTITDKIDFGDGGYNLDIFVHMMKRVLIQEMCKGVNFSRLKQYYVLTQELSKQMLMLNVNKKYLFENYILNLKCVSV